MKTLNDDIKREKEIKSKLKALEDKKKMLKEKEFQDNIKKLEKTKAILNDAIIKDEKKDYTVKITKLDIPEREQHKEIAKEKRFNKSLIAPLLMILGSIGNLVYQGIFNQDINVIYNVSYGLIFLIISILFLCAMIKYHKVYNYLLALLILLLIGLPILRNFNLIKLPTVSAVPNLVGMDYSDANKWCSDNKVNCTTTYDYSDFYEE